MTKYCKNCGNEIEEGSVFCNECGAPVDGGDANTSFGAGYNIFNKYKLNMIAGEKVIRKSEVNAACLILPSIVIAIGILQWLITVIITIRYTPIMLILGLFNIFTIFGAIWFAVRFIAYKNTDLILTNKRVFGKCGLISTTQMQSPLNMINSVTFKNGLFGKLLGYGTVEISTASTHFRFRFISEGETLYNDIFKQVEIANDEHIEKQAEAIAEAIGRRID